MIGLSCLSESELDFVLEHCDIEDGLKYFNPNVMSILPKEVVKRLPSLDFEIDEDHKMVTDEVIENLDEINEEMIVRAAHLRGFLG